ncbi:hypothetical protein BKA80DRAFT_272393 [Phyllosticta citrichinensis]
MFNSIATAREGLVIVVTHSSVCHRHKNPSIHPSPIHLQPAAHCRRRQTDGAHQTAEEEKQTKGLSSIFFIQLHKARRTCSMCDTVRHATSAHACMQYSPRSDIGTIRQGGKGGPTDGALVHFSVSVCECAVQLLLLLIDRRTDRWIRPLLAPSMLFAKASSSSSSSAVPTVGITYPPTHPT